MLSLTFRHHKNVRNSERLVLTDHRSHHSRRSVEGVEPQTGWMLPVNFVIRDVSRVPLGASWFDLRQFVFQHAARTAGRIGVRGARDCWGAYT